MNPDEYYKIAEKVGVFNAEELRSMDQDLDSCKWKPDDDNYRLVDIKDGKNVMGFAIFGRAPLSKFCWDIYWIAVKFNKQKKGNGKKLISLIENKILENNKYAIIRIETSSRGVYIPARKLYMSCGFKEECVIKDYFDKGDNLIVFSKYIGLAGI